MQLPREHPLNLGTTSNSSFVQHCRGNRTPHHPVWFMRQAGRSLPEYRRLRSGTEMLDTCLRPEAVVEITMQPVRRYGVDAAILFSDIVVPLRLAGLSVTIAPGVGPVLAAPIRSQSDARRLSQIPVSSLTPITRAVRMLVDELGETPLIGFGAAPFTLASYLVEGAPSRTLPHVHAMMQDQPMLWHQILQWCADITAQFVVSQVSAGASALQIFDSWAGRLTPQKYREFALPHSSRLFAQLSELKDHSGISVPRIHFGVGTRQILTPMFAAGATVMGVDSNTSLSDVTRELGPSVPVQGNISPNVLTEPWPVIEHHVRDVLRAGSGAAGHIVSLGHGVPPQTNPEVLNRITSFVQNYPS